MPYLTYQVLLSRVKSYLWHAFGIGTMAVLTWLVQEIGFLQLSPQVESLVVVVLGLLQAEVTKYWNVNKPWIKSQLL